MKIYLQYATFLIIMASAIILGGCSQNNKQNSQDEQPQLSQNPNIIYILADDLGYGDLSCFGQNKFQTPHIDKIAESGIKFTNHYSGSTVCAPSRSTLMTGLHTGHTPIRGNKEWKPEGQWPMPADTYTLAEMLKGAGYMNGVFGKWGLGYPGSEGDPNRQGFDEFYGYNCQRIAHNYYPWHLWHNQEKIMLAANEGSAKERYAPDLIQEKVLDFIENNKDTTFFLFYAAVQPHAELAAPEEYMQKFRGKFLPEKSYEGVDSGENFKNGPYGSQPESHAAFAAMVAHLDNMVGEVIAKVKSLGIEKNTLIIFTSDNGPHKEGGADPDYFDSNGPLKGYKRDLYEGGIRVPMLAMWPDKIQPGTESAHISSFWDVLPTCAEITGSTPPENIDGISFLPALLNQHERQDKHDYLYWEFHERGGRLALRKDDWKLVQYNVNRQPVGDFELYNLSEDPSEQSDLAGTFPEKVTELSNLMAQARTESDIFKFKSKTYNAQKSKPGSSKK
ncbi:arylsulfatase [Fulvivirgaceae bacterium BMA12]|uniref:Arylsulfatase n=1 Tax=Agaribacillus aureus TaxID=3051825 RepID=A0ABT8LM75_9BACT|nr:arylsulfatase [Fulvivirgaceae bacterium BMA12]